MIKDIYYTYLEYPMFERPFKRKKKKFLEDIFNVMTLALPLGSGLWANRRDFQDAQTYRYAHITAIYDFTCSHVSSYDSLYFKSSSTSGLSSVNGFRFSTMGVWSGSTRMRILLVSRERGSVRGRSSLYEATADDVYVGDVYGT